MKLNGIRGEDLESIHLAQNRAHLWAAVGTVVKVHGNEPSSIKIGEFLDQMRDYQLLKKDCSAKLAR
jgi:hypothetical protein